jgi:hypothetical protein
MGEEMHKLFLLIAVAHLSLAAAGAADLKFPERWGHWLNYYSDASGCSTGFGFFSPGVASQLRAVFAITDAKKHQQIVNMGSSNNRESQIRFGNIVDQFESDEIENHAENRAVKSSENDSGNQQMEFQRDLAASLSAEVFTNHPNAKSVTIHLEMFKPVSMENYRLGLRPKWEPLYSAEFSNKNNRINK